MKKFERVLATILPSPDELRTGGQKYLGGSNNRRGGIAELRKKTALLAEHHDQYCKMLHSGLKQTIKIGIRFFMKNNILLLVAFLMTMHCSESAIEPSPNDWICVGGDRGCQRYSSIKQIDQTNVGQLEVAWTYHTGELKNGIGRTIECTPLIVDGVMYITTADRRVIALDGATGKEIWQFDPLSAGPNAGPLASGGVNRGAAYWTDGKVDGARRILHGTSDGRLFSLDARTGKLDEAFGNAGVKDLREDLEPKIGKLPYGPTSAPAIFEDIVILCVSV